MQWVAAAVEEKGEATQEIARNVKKATSITHEVTTNVTEVTMAAQQTGAASNEVLSPLVRWLGNRQSCGLK